MKELVKSGIYTYYKIEEAAEVDRFRIPGEEDGYIGTEGFDFFRGLGIIGYRRTFKMWLRKFPRPIFIVAVDGNKIASWVYVEEWGETAKDGESIYVLRAIETLARLRRKKIGFRLLLLSLQQTVGYMITKPLTQDAASFFKGVGFMDESEFRRCPVDLSKHHGYLVLPPFRKKKLLEIFDSYFTNYPLPRDESKNK